ncbi:MAG TPA: hypothetical protein VJ787_06300 [Thermoleophilia bacterium]|nr:hypothetical protein [Thermoleophilia bacterium]
MDKMVAIWLAFFILAAAALVVVWWFARRAKNRFAEEGKRDRRHVISDLDVPPAIGSELAGFTPEPIFLKQGEDGVRVQLENKPFIPLHFLTDQGVAGAMRQVALAVSQRFGPCWACLVTARPDGRVTVRRLN